MAVLPARSAEGAGGVVRVVAAGGSPAYGHGCAVIDTGVVKCWGGNDFGRLGDGTTIDRTSPVDVVGLGGPAVYVATGAAHSCALIAGGAVKCWGANNHGELGDGTFSNSMTPVNVSGLASDVFWIAAGEDHTCAVLVGGAVKCWGRNQSGQLGDGTTTNRNTPVNVSGLASDVLWVAAGWAHTCALRLRDSLPTGGSITCWGDNSFGQLGDGTTTNRSTPADVAGLASDAVWVALGRNHTCAVIDTTGVQCWGRNHGGQLGDGTTTDRSTPSGVCADPGCSSPLYDVGMVVAGERHTCAVTYAPGMKCWGDNSAGQLGDGTTTGRTTPVDVSGVTASVTWAAAASGHTCTLLPTGAVQCWGRNHQGQVGDGTTTNRSTPVGVIGLGAKVAVGDVNCDGQTDSIDAALVLQYVAGLVTSLPCLDAGNVNGDDTISSIDAALILQYSAALIPSLPP
jgi:alpha-tubulin suppressor-like RCC1 family protein